MRRGHATPRAEEPLYDLDIPTPSHSERARTLLATLQIGTLATVAKEPEGHPYPSFVTFALDGGDPVFLVSEMAEHTQNLRRDPRASLLAAESRMADPLANGRVTLLGECRPVAEGDTTARGAYLERLPNAAYYCDFDDFGFWRLRVESVRYIGGYGRMSWVSAESWATAEPDPLRAHAEGIAEHMNQDHADAMVTMCRAFSRAKAAEEVTMTGINRYGFEM
ncbi:MAG: pyridoxamine 5'-phosphate oxidase family protein [Holophagales bacterium]|nr:pyridoxamine 5'-phosphate oxidase family protein [Holophagales bacterium]